VLFRWMERKLLRGIDGTTDVGLGGDRDDDDDATEKEAGEVSGRGGRNGE